MDKFSIELTQLEADGLIDLLQKATLAHGLFNGVAKNAVYFHDKLVDTYQANLKAQEIVRDLEKEPIKKPIKKKSGA